MLLGTLMLLLRRSGSSRECALDGYICRKESRRAGREGERVGCTQSLMPGELDVRRLQAMGVFAFLLLARGYAKGREGEAYADENGYVVIHDVVIHGRIGGRFCSDLYMLLSLPLVRERAKGSEVNEN